LNRGYIYNEQMSSAKLVLLRHGQSVWNLKNVFTGWVDVPLSPKGIEEALNAGKALSGIEFDVGFTSTLVRAQMTMFLAMSERERLPVVQHPDEGWSKAYNKNLDILPIFYHNALNERMYGELQGKNKDETRAEFGEEQVHIWRRSYDVAPPGGESLKMTKERTLPYFDHKIVPYLKDGKNVIISAHGNSLRSIVMELDDLSAEEVVKVEIPTGQPIIYTYEDGKWSK